MILAADFDIMLFYFYFLSLLTYIRVKHAVRNALKRDCCRTLSYHAEKVKPCFSQRDLTRERRKKMKKEKNSKGRKDYDSICFLFKIYFIFPAYHGALLFKKLSLTKKLYSFLEVTPIHKAINV